MKVSGGFVGVIALVIIVWVGLSFGIGAGLWIIFHEEEPVECFYTAMPFGSSEVIIPPPNYPPAPSNYQEMWLCGSGMSFPNEPTGPIINPPKEEFN